MPSVWATLATLDTGHGSGIDATDRSCGYVFSQPPQCRLMISPDEGADEEQRACTFVCMRRRICRLVGGDATIIESAECPTQTRRSVHARAAAAVLEASHK